MPEYNVTITDKANPGKAHISARVPDGPSLMFSRKSRGADKDVLTLKVNLTPEQSRSFPGGFEVEPVESARPLRSLSKDELARLAADQGIEVQGSGAGGAVTKDDLLEALEG